MTSDVKNRSCKYCEKVIYPPKRIYCSNGCKSNWNGKFKYGNKYTFKYRSANPRNFLQGLSKKIKERRDLSIDFLYELFLIQNGKCAISGRDMTYIAGEGRIPTNISIDRINSSIGYEEENIQLVCRQANVMKMELSHEELYSWCEDILTKRKTK